MLMQQWMLLCTLCMVMTMTVEDDELRALAEKWRRQSDYEPHQWMAEQCAYELEELIGESDD